MILDVFPSVAWNRTLVTNVTLADAGNWTWVNKSITDMLNNTTPETFFGPVHVAMSPFGGFFYPLLILFTVGLVWIKSQSFAAATFVLILLSVIAVQFVPAEVQWYLYIMVVLGIAGLLYSAYRGGGGV